MKRKYPIKKYQWHLSGLVVMVAVVLLLASCKEKDENLVPFSYDPEMVPSLVTNEGSTLVSDSGITRYKLVYDAWMVFDKAQKPYWFFPEGLYVEQFTPDFDIELVVEAEYRLVLRGSEAGTVKEKRARRELEGRCVRQ